MTEFFEWVLNYSMELVVMAAMGGFFGYVRKSGKQEKARNAATVDLLRAQILNTYNHYLPRKAMPIYAKETLSSLHERYKDLGGNGAIDSICKEAMEWPTK